MGHLFDYLMRTYKLRNDTEISWHLGISPALISQLRRGQKPSATLILKVYDTTTLSIPKIRLLMGLPRGRGRL